MLIERDGHTRKKNGNKTNLGQTWQGWREAIFLKHPGQNKHTQHSSDTQVMIQHKRNITNLGLTWSCVMGLSTDNLICYE